MFPILTGVFYWVLLFLFIYALCYGLEVKKDKQLAITLVNFINTYVYIYTTNNNWLLAYYCYDLYHQITNCSFIYIVHHLASIYVIEYARVYQSVKLFDLILLMKIGDLFIHIPKVIKQTEFYNMYPMISNILISINMLLSIALYVIFRIVLPINYYPFEYPMMIFAVGFHISNVLWCCKLAVDLRNLISNIISTSRVSANTPNMSA